MGAGLSFLWVLFNKRIAIAVLLFHPQNISLNIYYQECFESSGNQSFRVAVCRNVASGAEAPSLLIGSGTAQAVPFPIPRRQH
jgi:hypothetical protein